MRETPRICDLTSVNKPRERLLQKGATALSDSELLAIILRSGGNNASALDLANFLLKEFDGYAGLLSADFSEINAYKNMGIAKTACVKALCEIGLRLGKLKTEKKLKINNPHEVFKLMRNEVFAKDKEHLFLICLDVRGNFISKDLISIGTLNESLVGVHEIFKKALIRNSSQIILVHNHPSGDPTPSEEDLKVTKTIYLAGKILNIVLIDHVIVCDNDFASIKAENIFSKYKFF